MKGRSSTNKFIEPLEEHGDDDNGIMKKTIGLQLNSMKRVTMSEDSERAMWVRERETMQNEESTITVGETPGHTHDSRKYCSHGSFEHEHL